MLSGRYDSKFVPLGGILSTRLEPTFIKNLLNISAIILFISDFFCYWCLNSLGIYHYILLDFPITAFMTFQVFFILFSYCFKLFWKWSFFDCFFNFSNKFLYMLQWRIQTKFGHSSFTKTVKHLGGLWVPSGSRADNWLGSRKLHSFSNSKYLLYFKFNNICNAHNSIPVCDPNSISIIELSKSKTN